MIAPACSAAFLITGIKMMVTKVIEISQVSGDPSTQKTHHRKNLTV